MILWTICGINFLIRICEGEYVTMNILITGSLSHLAVNFIKLYHTKFSKLVLIDAVSYCSNDKSTTPTSEKIINIYKDINNIDLLELMETHHIDIFLHCAASTHVDRSYIHYDEFINNNVFAVHKILEAIIKYKKLTKFIHMSTDEIYGGSTSITFNEKSMFNPTNNYASSKASSEMIINAYAYSYKLPVIIIRPNNLFGKYQYKEKVIPKFINKLLRNKPITIHGDGRQIRDFIYTEEVCRAIKFIIDSNINKGTYNVGVENPININELAYSIYELVKKKNMTKLGSQEYKVHIRDRLHNDKRYKLDCSKIQRLGFTPTNDWKQCITTTVNFYCDEYSKKI